MVVGAVVTAVVMPITPMMPIVVIIVAVTRIFIIRPVRRPVIEGRNANSEIHVHSSLGLTRCPRHQTQCDNR
jgi:hypothetical protein